MKFSTGGVQHEFWTLQEGSGVRQQSTRDRNEAVANQPRDSASTQSCGKVL
jgi:hypothetical protein